MSPHNPRLRSLCQQLLKSIDTTAKCRRSWRYASVGWLLHCVGCHGIHVQVNPHFALVCAPGQCHQHRMRARDFLEGMTLHQRQMQYCDLSKSGCSLVEQSVRQCDEITLD